MNSAASYNLHSMEDYHFDSRSFGRRCDFLQPHPADVTILVNGITIFVCLRRSWFHGSIADTAFRQSQFLDKSQECWHCATSEYESSDYKD
jgi:hypothetical protein